MNSNAESEIKALEEKLAVAKAHFEREKLLIPTLPSVKAARRFICMHARQASISYEVDTFKEAVDIYDAFAASIVDCEAWTDSCCSVTPPEINSCKKNGKLEFVSHVELKQWSYGEKCSYNDTELGFFARSSCGELLDVTVKIKTVPFPVNVIENRDSRTGRIISRNWLFSRKIESDNQKGWWSEPTYYSRTFHWKDAASFLTWARKIA